MPREPAAQGFPVSVRLYWDGRRPGDLYDAMGFSGLDLRWVPVLSRAGADRRGHVRNAMIHPARKRLLAARLPAHHFYSGAFMALN